MSTEVENNSSSNIEYKPKNLVTSNTGANVEIIEPDYIVHAQRKEYKVVSDNIYIPKLYDDAPQWMKDIIGTVVDVKTAVATGNLNDALEALRTLATELEVAKNTYTMSIISSNDIDQRINTKIETLNASLADADATILNIAQTAVTTEEASAIAINTLSASLGESGEIGSFIAEMNAAFANLDSATTESINYMESAIEAEFSATATAVQTLRTYVGVDEDGNSIGTGLFADVDLLKKQTDGIIETKTGTYDVILNASNPNTAQLVVTAEPYVTWKAADATGISTRLAHIGDVYIKYSTNANGSRNYIASYKFIKTEVDITSPFSTDTDGFTWALVVDQAAQDAYTQALNAYTLADGKSSIYYGTLALRDSTSNAWTTAEKTSNIGDIWVISDTGNDQNKQFRWNGSSWVDIRDKKIVANAEEITKLQADLTSETGLRVSGDTTVTNTVKAYADTVGVGVESKWAYNSIVGINGVYKKSGFGLTTNYTSGTGTQANPYVSEFWIDAGRLKFTNSNMTGSKAPFTIDATGVVPEITFNGKVSFDNVTGYTPPNVSGDINTNNDVFAQKLGYANYAAMANAASLGQTIINGGYVNTLLLQANSITANKIASYNLTASNASIANGMITNAMIGDAQINNAKISNLSVDTLKIQDQAVTIPISTVNYNQISFAQSYVEVAAIGFVSSGAPVTLFLSAVLNAGSLRSVDAKVTRDGYAVYNSVTTSVGQSAGQYGNIVFNLRDVCGSGYHEYRFYLSCSVGTTYATQSTIIGLETKK